MDIFYKPVFNKFVKKQSRAFQLAIEGEVEKVLTSPGLGENKKGDLSEFKVHKFIFHKQEYLIACTLQKNRMIFYMIGTHENFYRKLKKYVKEIQ